MKTTFKIITLVALTFSLSVAYGQDEIQNAQKVRTKSNGANDRISNTPTVGKQTTAQGTGERKGWDGTIKGSNVVIMPSSEGISIVFPDDIAFEVNETEKIIKGPGKSKGGATASGARGLPVKGSIVKGGKNPGPNTKIIKPSETNTYTLPEDWNEDGEYILQISYETADKSKLMSEFILTKKGNGFQVQKGAGSPKQAGF